MTFQTKRQRKSLALTTFRSTFAGASIDLNLSRVALFRDGKPFLKRNVKQGAPTKEIVNAHQ